MYQRIMVPLDGSSTAEMTIPYATEFASNFNSEIILFSVIEPGTNVAESLFHSYLRVVHAKIQAEMQKRGIKDPVVRTEIVPGNPASEILRYADNKKVDLIIVAGRGSSTEGDWALGNIATKIVRIASQPVMLIKQPVKDTDLNQKKLFNKILVPLDGSRVGEGAVPHAEAIARKWEAQLVLIHVVEPAPWPTTNNVITARDEKQVQAALTYLDGFMTKMRDRNFRVNIHLATGYPAEEITRYVDANAVDLIAISTHGRSGVGRWAIGSVTDKLLYSCNIPILVEHSVNATAQS